MIQQHTPSPLCAALTAVALSIAPLACKDSKTEDKPTAADGSKAAADGQGAADGKVADDGGEGDAAAGNAGGGLLGAAKNAVGLAGAGEIVPDYPKELDPLLDLVPADADTVIVVRDLDALLQGSLAYALAATPSLDKLADEIAKEDPGDAKDMREGLAKIVEFEKALAASGIDLEAGAVIAGKQGSGKEVVVYGSAKADALPTMMATIGASADAPKNCAPVASVAGYAICTKADPAAYTPAKKSADLRRTMTTALPGVDLDRANVVAFFPAGDSVVPLAMETGQGMAHLAVGVPQARDNLKEFVEPSKGAALGLLAPGQGFVWGQVAKAKVTEAGTEVPPMAQGVVKTLTGEFFVGGVTGHKGAAVLIGLNDPAPAAGMVALASMGIGEIPKSLPDGTAIDASVRTVHGAQAVNVKFSGTKHVSAFSDMGFSPEAYAFAAGGYAAITVGASEDVVSAISGYGSTGPSKEVLAALPKPLARALESGSASVAAYAPVDSVQTQQANELFGALAAAIPAGELGRVDGVALSRAASNAAAVLSSLSFWITDLDSGPVFHVALQGIAEPGTEEGTAAFEAIKAVEGGADRSGTWSDLATKFPRSPHAASYQLRAAEAGDPLSSVVAVSTLLGFAGAMLYFGLRPVSAVSTGFVEAPPPVPPPAVPAPAPTK